MFAGWVNRKQADVIDYLKEENRVLREMLGPKPIRLDRDQRRRLAVKGKLLGRKALREVAAIATPDTILRWYRKLVADKYDGSRKRARGPGRRRTKEVIRVLVVRMAVENTRWGYTRIRGALRNLGIELGHNTIKRILLEHGIEPAPERGKRMPWKTFLKAHWGEIAAADFFTVEVLTLVGLVRYHVFFFIDLESRRVEIAGIVHNPGNEWMAQAARNLVDAFAGFLKDHRYIILEVYAANIDWSTLTRPVEGRNWRAGRKSRNRSPGDPQFQFFIWDVETAMGAHRVSPDYVTDLSDTGGIWDIHRRLKENPTYRAAFAERVQLHFVDGGALTPEAALARFETRLSELGHAVLPESARWGDQMGSERYGYESHWLPEIDYLRNTYFPNRSAEVVQQFAAQGLY